jgi:putative ABC transport system permease protein
LATTVGLIVVISLTVSVPMYSDAVYNRILHNQVTVWGDNRRPPFAYMYRYVGSESDAVDWQTVARIDQMMQVQVPGMLGMPRQLLVRYFASAAYPLFANKDAAYKDQRQPVLRSSFGMLGGFSDHITLVDGAFPMDIPFATPDEVMPVLVSKTLADKLGLQVGERYLAYDELSAEHEATKASSQIPIVISGIWTPRDTTDPYWYANPAEYQTVLFTSESNFTRRLIPQLKGQQYITVWYMAFDGDGIRSGDVSTLLDRMKTTLTRAVGILPSIRMDLSPEVALKRYQTTSNLLTIQLFAFNVPILALAFVFIALVAGLKVDNQRNEIAVLRSRGASVLQILGITFIEACVLCALALAASAPAGERVAQLVGKTRSFMDFVGVLNGAGAEGLPTSITLDSLRTGLITIVLAVLVAIAPTLSAAEHTVITYKQDRARALRPPWWQRIYLDVLIMIPAAYGSYLLQKQGTVAIAVDQVVTPGGANNDPFSNPLLFMVPILALIALSLFIIRLLPLLLRILSWMLKLLPGTSMLLAIRQLARSPSFYAAPILLLILTLALATFMSSLAVTIDQSMIDQVRYRIGSDMTVTESSDLGSGANATTLAQDAALSEKDRAAIVAAAARPQLVKSMLPVQDHTRVADIEAAARVGRYPASIRLGGDTLRAEYIGVDRQDFARVSFWRKDFSSVSLGALMNVLAAAPDGVLVPDTVMSKYGLNIGDPVIARVSLKDGSAELTLRVVGVFKLWPGWYPKETDGTMLFVGSLDNLFEQAGYQAPYKVLLRTKDGSDVAKIALGILDTGFNLIRYESADSQIKLEQARPERQGLFGVLSVGFVATALLTVLGFFLYAVFSFRRRLIEIGVLRAIGFSALQTAAFIGWELVLLLGIGIGAGTGLGIAASRLYIPFMQVQSTAEAGVIPYQVIIAWPNILDVYALFGAMFVIALLVLMVFLMRMKVFQAVKLGESM